MLIFSVCFFWQVARHKGTSLVMPMDKIVKSGPDYEPITVCYIVHPLALYKHYTVVKLTVLWLDNSTFSSDEQKTRTGPSLPRNACQIIKYSCTLHEAYGLRTLFVHTTWHINGHSEERSKTRQYFTRRKILTVWNCQWVILLCKRQNNTRKQRGVKLL